MPTSPSHHTRGGSPYSLLLLLLVAVLDLLPLRAQDVHYSQIDINPVLFNPAYTAFFDGRCRAGMVYRNQWASVSDPFQTLSFSAEAPLWHDRYGHQGFGVGLLFFRDKAGSLNYGTTSASLMAAYFLSLDDRFPHYLSLGVEAGYNQAGFSIDDIQLQDPSESLDRWTVRYPTLGVGLAWSCAPTDLLQLRAGLSLRNLNRPNISYMDLDDTYLQPKWNGYVRAEFRCWQSVSLLPVAIVQFQDNNREIVYGTDVKWYLDESDSRYLTLSAGILMRHADAATLMLSAEYNAFLFSFGYDANISKLVDASHTLGAFELGIVYRLARRHSKKHKALPCPIM